MTDTIERIEAGEPAIVIEEKNAMSEQLQKIRAQLQTLAVQNSDTYGWISVEGTNINYPIVQGAVNRILAPGPDQGIAVFIVGHAGSLVEPGHDCHL